MNKSMVVSLALTASAVIVLATYFFFGGEALTIRGGDIQVLSTAPLTIQGSFYIGPPDQVVDVPGHGQTVLKSQWPTILSHGTGGACLIADLNDDLNIPPKSPMSYNGQCQTDDDCHKAMVFLTLPPGRNTAWSSYCVENTCWTRPGLQATHCLTSKVQGKGAALPPGHYTFGPDPSDPTNYRIADFYAEFHDRIVKPITWRVHACLNGSGGITGDNGACGRADGAGSRLIDNGPPSDVPKN